MSTSHASHDLALLLSGHVPLVVLEARDEQRALRAVVEAVRSDPARSTAPMFRWTVTDGLAPMDAPPGTGQRFNTEAVEVLRHIRASDLPGVYVLLDLHPFLTDPVVVRLLKDVAQGSGSVARTVVLISRHAEIPPELEHLATRTRVALPHRGERAAVVDRVVHEWARRTGRLVDVDPRARDLLVENLGGLSMAEVERLARGAVMDGAITHDDVPRVQQAKYELLARTGVLRYEHDLPGVGEIGGMGSLMRWLQLRRPALDGSSPGLVAPRGVLLLGVQGCGKSMAAKVAAGVFGVPLLRLDLASVHDKYVGESERILRETLATAETLAPCVLWIDEIEKAVAADRDGGAARRVLGVFLTWLAERSASVFVVATANDIAGLPPELVRKGRFDELFFVDLPDAEARAHILTVHAGLRGVVLDRQDAAELAAHSEGFSGAELEQAVVSAVYAAHAEGVAIDSGHVLAELRGTRPLSVVMGERIAELRAWAAGRTVPAA